MSEMSTPSGSKLYWLWAIPLLAIGAVYLFRAMQSGLLHHALLGAGLLLGGAFACRHNLLDLSPKGLDVRRLGMGWVVVLGLSVLLVLAAAAVGLAK